MIHYKKREAVQPDGWTAFAIAIISERGVLMNIRKNIDYSEMYDAIDSLMEKELPQMELYCEIGKAVCRRTEKGAAVMASEYLNKQYPDVKGFSPRSLRRMRDFYRTYENHSALLSRAMKLGWIQNVVIMEADLTMDLREWYMKAAEQFGWSKTELIANITANTYENIVLAIEEEVCYSEKKKRETGQEWNRNILYKDDSIFHLIERIGRRIRAKEGGRRRWPIMLCQIFTEKRIVFMRC